MTRDEIERWERTRERGLLHYMVVVGVGRAGIGFFAVFAVLDYLTRFGFEYTPVLVPHVLKWLPGSVVVGAIFGFFLYRIMDKRYRESLAEE